MHKQYLTIKATNSARLEINKSIFIAHAKRTESENEALAFAAEIRKKYHDATHNCFACIAGPQDEFQKADDDGEPSGDAGKPMLEVIKKNLLRDTSIVVTRYFGGIKLGGGGLIRAYGKSASEAIRAAGVVERTLHSRIGITIAYTLLGPLENQLRMQGYTVVDKQFTNLVSLSVLAETGQEDRLQKLATDIAAGAATFSELGFAYVDREINESA
jgi:uncharacterized YigZ family protein